MQFLDALHARFVCLNNFVCFSLGQVLLPLIATPIAYFVLVLALALTLTHSLVVVVDVALLMAIDIYGFASI